MERVKERVKERLKWILHWLSREGEDSSSCRFSDEEIVIDWKLVNAGWIEEVWISIPVDALSKTDSSVVYYDPSQLRDTISQA